MTPLATTDEIIAQICVTTKAPKCLVVALAAVSLPLRRALKSYLTSQTAVLQLKANEFLFQSMRTKVMSLRLGGKSLSKWSTGIERGLAEFDAKFASVSQLMVTLPLGKVAASCPAVNKLLKQMKTGLSDVGIHAESLEDLRLSKNALAFNIKKVSDYNTYANKAKTMIEQRITVLNQWKDVLDLIDSMGATP